MSSTLSATNSFPSAVPSTASFPAPCAWPATPGSEYRPRVIPRTDSTHSVQSLSSISSCASSSRNSTDHTAHQPLSNNPPNTTMSSTARGRRLSLTLSPARRLKAGIADLVGNKEVARKANELEDRLQSVSEEYLKTANAFDTVRDEVEQLRRENQCLSASRAAERAITKKQTDELEAKLQQALQENAKLQTRIDSQGAEWQRAEAELRRTISELTERCSFLQKCRDTERADLLQQLSQSRQPPRTEHVDDGEKQQLAARCARAERERARLAAEAASWEMERAAWLAEREALAQLEADKRRLSEELQRKESVIQDLIQVRERLSEELHRAADGCAGGHVRTATGDLGIVEDTHAARDDAANSGRRGSLGATIRGIAHNLQPSGSAPAPAPSPVTTQSAPANSATSGRPSFGSGARLLTNGLKQLARQATPTKRKGDGSDTPTRADAHSGLNL